MSDSLLRTIFEEALDRPTAAERARFLDEACGSDAALRQQVEVLLQANEKAGSFFADTLKKPTSPEPTDSPLTEKPGDRLGRYKLLQEIGEGGCGIVYMAEQEEPVRRRVALKVIKLGMDSRTWSALGSNSPGGSIMAASGNDLYVSNGGMVSKWDGTNWTTLPFILGAISDLRLNALAVVGNDLYIGGTFDRVYVTNYYGEINFIARWDGTNLSVPGSGVSAPVSALLISGNTLYAGGDFTVAGGKAAAFLAKANLPVAAGQFENWAYSPATGLNWMFTGGTMGQPYRIQSSPSLAVGSWIDFTNFTYTTPAAIRDPSAISGSNRFFRAVSP